MLRSSFRVDAASLASSLRQVQTGTTTTDPKN
jgi:hypothetical protein